MKHTDTSWLKPAAYIITVSLSCLLFSAFTPPLLTAQAAMKLPLIGSLPGDLPSYWARFILSFLLLGVFPGIVALLFKESPRRLGLIFNIPLFRKGWFWLLVPLAMAVGALGTLSPDLAAFYPYSRDLIPRVQESGLGPFWIHILAYGLLYYLPWEFFFRGFLLFPLALSAQEALRSSPDHAMNKNVGTVMAAIVLFQTIPSTMLHFGHPLSELFGAMAGGILFGLMAWKTKSIFPGLILHAAMGIGTDLFIVLRMTGRLG